MNIEKSLPDYLPKRFGLKYDPPTIVLQYLVPSTGKLYHHRMKLRNLQKTSHSQQILENLKKRHSMYLETSKIQDQQILELITKVLNTVFPGVDYNSYDLNKLKPEEVQIHKDRMEAQFRLNSKRPGDPGYVYDCRKEFKLGEEETSWDEDF